MKAVAAALVLLAAGCEKPPSEVPPDPVINADAQVSVRDAGPKPHLITYRPPAAGGPDTFHAAIMSGVLDFSGPCLRLQDQSAAMRVIVTSPGTALKHDSIGWFLPSGRDRLRHGASVNGGGGEVASLPPADLLEVEVPAACRAGKAVELFGLQRSPAGRGRATIDDTPPPPAR